MAAQPEINALALDLMHRADHHMWLHQSNWMGEPILNTAQDILALQEIIFKTRPKYIMEVGVAWGGILLFYSTLMEILGGEKTLAQVKEIVGDCKDNLVVLDSHHTHDYVLNELRSYEQFVGKGNYMICGDTVIEKLPAEVVRKREWGHGNNPMIALHAFLKENHCFESDQELENKLLLSCHPENYLRRVSE